MPQHFEHLAPVPSPTTCTPTPPLLCGMSPHLPLTSQPVVAAVAISPPLFRIGIHERNDESVCFQPTSHRGQHWSWRGPQRFSRALVNNLPHRETPCQLFRPLPRARPDFAARADDEQRSMLCSGCAMRSHTTGEDPHAHSAPRDAHHWPWQPKREGRNAFGRLRYCQVNFGTQHIPASRADFAVAASRGVFAYAHSVSRYGCQTIPPALSHAWATFLLFGSMMCELL